MTEQEQFDIPTIGSTLSLGKGWFLGLILDLTATFKDDLENGYNNIRWQMLADCSL